MQQENAAGGFSDYNPEEDTSFHDIFERADGLMYEEKKPQFPKQNTRNF